MGLLNADEAQIYAKKLGLRLKTIKKYDPYSELTSAEKKKNPKQGKRVKGGQVSKEILDVISAIVKKFTENNLPDVMVTGGNDYYHRGLTYQSNHTLGNGIDIAFLKKVGDTELLLAEQIIFNIIATGRYDNTDGTRIGFINEYKRLSGSGTGTHLHFSVSKNTSAECVYPLLKINSFKEFDERKKKYPPTEDGSLPNEVGTESVDLNSVIFKNASDIDTFFRKFDTNGFVSWFNNNSSKFLKKGIPLNTISSSENWTKFWNLIPITFGRNSINLAEFLTLGNIVSVETGSSFFPKSEKVGMSGHPGIAYTFDRVPGLKISYNTLKGNITAFDLFNDPDYIDSHGHKTLGSLLINTTDVRWRGESFPLGFSGNSNKEVSSGGGSNDFIMEADFMKFRGRGFIQSTGRTKYNKILDFIKSYSGSNSNVLEYKNKWGSIINSKILTISTNKDWDILFQETDLVIASYAINVFSKSRKGLYDININSDKTINEDTFDAGWKTNGDRNYGDDIKAIVNLQLSELSIAPASPTNSDPNNNNNNSNSNDGSDNFGSNNDNNNDNNYPDDLPKVEGLTNFFRPTIVVKPIEFKMPAGEGTKNEVASTIGYQPFVWYLSYQLKFIKSLILSSKGLLPTIKLVFQDSQNIMTDDGFPLDDSKIKVFLNSRTPSLRPIFMEFKIVNFGRNGNTYTIDGICNINKFFLREFESYKDMSSFECMQEFARRSKLGFNSNISESDDKMTWINTGMRGSDFVKDVISTSYRSDESFIWCYVDYYYNLNYIDVEESLNIDISNQIQVKNTGIESINQITNGREETNKLWLSNDASMDQSNQYFSDWKIINNSTSISLNNGYLNKAKFYDINDKNYLIFDIDSMTSNGDKNIIMKGSPQDMEFYTAHVKPTYVGKLDGDNVHDNYNYSIIQNKQNIKDLQKIGVNIKLVTPNYNLYRYQKINVMFSGSVSTPSASQVNNRLSGDWLIIDIEFVFINEELNQKLTLIRRELGLSPDELKMEKQQQQQQQQQSNSENTENPGIEEKVIDTSGSVIEVALNNELIPFSYDLKFKNAMEIDDFFDQYNTKAFTGWFNDEFINTPEFNVNYKPTIGDGGELTSESYVNDSKGLDKKTWNKIWNSVDIIFNDNRNSVVEIIKQDFNIIEFLTLNTMIYYISGNKLKPKSDNRKIVDLFKNNILYGNKTSFDLFNDNDYILKNDNKPFSNILKNTTDISWQSDIFPTGFSGTSSVIENEVSKTDNDFITNSDFYKFRNRGLVSFVGRHDYGSVINFIKSYNGNDELVLRYKENWTGEINSVINKSTDADWSELINSDNMITPLVGLSNKMFDLQQVHIIPVEGRNETKISNSITNVAKLVKSVIENPDPNFVSKFVNMVNTQIKFLNSKKLVPAKPDDVEVISKFDLDLIPGLYVDNNGNKLKLCQIDGRAVNVKIADAYLTMKEAAKKDGIKLRINSAFRSPYDTIDTKSESGKKVKSSSQKYLYDGYKAGKSGFNLAASPGSSRHGDGIGLDLNAGGSSKKRFSNVNRKIYTWLVKNAWKFGFVRSVRKEEWHFDYLPGKVQKSGKKAYSRISGSDENKFYSDWNLDKLG